MFDDIASGRKSVEDIEPIEVVFTHGEYYARTGNRRLWVYKNLQHTEHIFTIPVVDMTNSNGIKSKKFTTRNGGTSVEITDRFY